jgi:hypothetical protein
MADVAPKAAIQLGEARMEAEKAVSSIESILTEMKQDVAQYFLEVKYLYYLVVLIITFVNVIGYGFYCQSSLL